MGVMEEPIKQGRDGGGVAEQPLPLERVRPPKEALDEIMESLR